MKKPFVALLLLVGAAAMVANMAFAQTGEPGAKLANAKTMQDLLKSRAQRLNTSAGGDPDTVYLGHSHSDHWNAVSNYWNIYTGNYFPGVNDPTNAIWDWDHSTGLSNHGVGDSLAGWWPIRRVYSGTGGLTLPDASRPWWAIDIGNQANYVMNAGAGGKRTIGVVGVWHADPGKPAGAGVMWSPLAGSKSAWCGLRQHGDNTVVDQITGNPFNQTVLEFNGEGVPTTPTTKHFPGYGSQMDQMLYRDLTPAAGQPLNISFVYRTRMSTGVDVTSSTRTGWFHGDPLSVTAGNFISSSAAGAAAPIDSFMVYVGAPVNDADCVYSDGVHRAVYDPQRRWFSEVLRINEGPSVPYYEIASAFGENPSDTNSVVIPSVNVTIPGTYVDAIRNAVNNTGGKVRLVFRLKTNRGFDDMGTAYTSNGRGAVQIDDVVVNGSNIGDFEGSEQGGVNTIDNRAGASATTNWKSTGKPPAIYFHLAALADLTWNELCGPPDSPARSCNIFGTVFAAGNADDAEHVGSRDYLSDREVQHGILSPTIIMATDQINNTPNAQGLTSTIVDATDDWYIWYDMYAGMFNLNFTGNSWTYGAQSFPAQMANGAQCWGELEVPGFIIFNNEPQCFTDFEPFTTGGVNIVGTSNVSLTPDSMRIFLGHNQQCFRFAVSLGCNSAEGCYFDNVSLAFTDIPDAAQVSATSAISVGNVSMDIWQLFNDAFPFNETAGLPATSAFDTTTAMVKGAINNAQATGNALRFDIPADTVVVVAGNAVDNTTNTGVATRVDLVFRILPGPGNYKISAGRAYPLVNTMQLLQVPSNQANVAVSGDASFWGQYMAAPGDFGTAGGHYGGTFWDPMTWNSARMDTVQANIFRVTGSKPGATGDGLTAGRYMTTYHELDPKYSTLGISKFKCFVVDTNQSAVGTNIRCDGFVPAWLSTVPQNRTGWDGTTTTLECTKIIPDGLLTPGSHVQYFIRKQDTAGLGVAQFAPDTALVDPQNRESSRDGHRWQQFGVLPDKWKGYTAAGMACMLYVDYNDRRGNERVWVSVMDSLGGTAQAKWGAHNGWHQGAGSTGINDPAGFVSNNQQPGTTWDMYGVKASESLTTQANAFGSRYSNRASMGLATGKQAMTGPTKEMLRTYYRVIALLSGDLNSGVLGPFVNRSQDDIDLLNDYLTNSLGTAQPRGLLISGDGFGQSENQTAGAFPQHGDFLTQKLGWSLRNASYQSVSANLNTCADLLTTNVITSNGDVYGVGNSCTWSNDLLQRNPALTEATEASFYEPVGVNAPYTASVYKPSTGGRPWVALSEAFEIEHIYGRYCATSMGRVAYYWNMINNVFGSLCTLTGSAATTLDVPQNNSGGKYANFMKIGNSVMRTGNATINFGVSGNDRVKVKLYDVTGRQIRTLADRSFAAGTHSLTWDGSDDSGNQVARGVYFARIEYATKGAPINGRVVVLR
ncbi:MAG: FlgD immunoglobulin-like domain containing protein [Candidatus Eisenbacteria bacterium]